VSESSVKRIILPVLTEVVNFRNFLPDAGRLIHTRAPVNSPHRLETGFVEGDEVSSYYDPMVSRSLVSRAITLISLG
jgi:acetyl/propionyl-CoA carboxylase alpha subunit